jgi:hypothetical protein
MIEIVLSVCLLANPSDCKDVSLSQMGEKVTPYACMFRGQVAASRWAEGHPEYKIAKWKCQAGREFAKL